MLSWVADLVFFHQYKLTSPGNVEAFVCMLGSLTYCSLLLLLIDLDFLFHMFFLGRYCKLLEENSFRGRTADFFYMLLFGASVLTGIVLIGGMIPYVSESFARIIFLSNSLTFMMVSFICLVALILFVT